MATPPHDLIVMRVKQVFESKRIFLARETDHLDDGSHFLPFGRLALEIILKMYLAKSLFEYRLDLAGWDSSLT